MERSLLDFHFHGTSTTTTDVYLSRQINFINHTDGGTSKKANLMAWVCMFELDESYVKGFGLVSEDNSLAGT
jgi:hypothetical protein